MAPKHLIEGVSTRKINRIPDQRGYLMEMFRSDWPEFKEFGQVYVTSCEPGVVKGFHYHKKQTDSFICLYGMAKIVLFDDREESPTKNYLNEFFIGDENPMLVQTPPLVHHGFMSIRKTNALIVNVPTHLYNYDEPDEYRYPYDMLRDRIIQTKTGTQEGYNWYSCNG